MLKLETIKPKFILKELNVRFRLNFAVSLSAGLSMSFPVEIFPLGDREKSASREIGSSEAAIGVATKEYDAITAM